MPSLGYNRSPEELFFRNDGQTSQLMTANKMHIDVSRNQTFIDEQLLIDGKPLDLALADELHERDVNETFASREEVPEEIRHLDFDFPLPRLPRGKEVNVRIKQDGNADEIHIRKNNGDRNRIRK